MWRGRLCKSRSIQGSTEPRSLPGHVATAPLPLATVLAQVPESIAPGAEEASEAPDETNHGPPPESSRHTTVPQAVDVPPDARVRASVVMFNVVEGLGQARLPDGRLVWLHTKDFVGAGHSVMPRDTVEFDLCESKHGLEGRAIRTARADGRENRPYHSSSQMAQHAGPGRAPISSRTQQASSPQRVDHTESRPKGAAPKPTRANKSGGLSYYTRGHQAWVQDKDLPRAETLFEKPSGRTTTRKAQPRTWHPSFSRWGAPMLQLTSCERIFPRHGIHTVSPICWLP